MTHESHASPNALAGLLLVDSPLLALNTDRLLDGATRDADLVGTEHELFEREAAVGRVLDEIVETRSDIDDIPDFVAREPSLLLLRIHERKSTGSGRSVLRQVDIDDLEVGQPNRTVPIAEVGRLLLVARDAGSTGGPIR